ncbi:caspase family protein [Streptomyces sp. NPDC000348]|uniref:caspase, EACC1-associated type n=1 Tax=Streptomyces sp. NPDC000348 TaxID=3364538 RepID=UPI003678B80A
MAPQPPGLTGAGAHAVVVGTGTHPGDLLHDLPSAVRSARALAEALRTECGMGDRVRLLTDPRSPSEVLEALAEAADRAAPNEERYDSGVVLFVYVGHGLRGPGGRLYLATAATKSLTDTAHSVPYAEVERYLGDAAADPVVILDCCFAGNAREPGRPPASDPFAGARPDGSYLLGSALPGTVAYAPGDAEHTLFSGLLLELLREGDAGGPRWLTPGSVYRLLDQRLQGVAARPHGGGTARMAELVLTANRRYAPGTGEDEPAPADPDAVCPYPGILPFLPEQHHLFFGREEVTRRLVERVRGTRPGEPLLVIGTSGVGKSSLLRAGLTAAAPEAGLGPVRIVPAPGTRPLDAVAEAWAAAVGRPLADVVQDLERGGFGPPGTRPAPGVLVLDQLEECVTRATGPDERRRLTAALAAVDGPRIVLALRADYLDDVLKDPHLAPFAEHGHFTVPAMGDGEIEAAIVEPARYAGLTWEEGVPRILRREVNEERRGAGAGDAAALPYLAHVLREIWLRRRGTTLTYAAYQQAGGIREAVARTADEIHDGLDATGRDRLRTLMLSMVHVADGEGRLVRRRVPREELTGAGDLLRRLADARLVVVDEHGGARLGHDSLLHAWQPLTGWIEEARDDLLRLRRLTAAAEGWDEAGRRASGLYAGDALTRARELTDRTSAPAAAPVPVPVPVPAVVRDFVAAGERAQRRRRAVTRAWTAGLTALALVATTLAGWALYENGQAASREKRLIAREIAARATGVRAHDPQTALRLSLAAYRTAETPETRAALYESAMTSAPVHLAPEEPHREPVLGVAWRADGEVLAVSHRGGRVQLWDTAEPGVPAEAGRIPAGGTAAVAVHPRRPLLAAQSAKHLTVWDIADPREPERLADVPVTGGTTFSVAFSGDGRTLAAGSAGGRLRLWDVSTPDRPVLRTERTVVDAELVSVAFTHDGHHLLTGNGHGEGAGGAPAQVRLWDVADPARPLLRDTETVKTLMAVAAHPRRDLAVATGGGSTVAWWRLSDDGRELRRVPVDEFADSWGSVDGVPSLSFSGDGRFLAGAAQDDGVLRMRTDAEASVLANDPPGLAGHPAGEPVQSVAYRPDGRWLAAGETGGEVRLWSRSARAPSVPGFVPRGQPAGTSSFSADGALVLTETENARGDGVTQVWDVGDPQKPRLRYSVPEEWEARYFLTSRERPVLLAHRWEGGRELVFQLWEFDEAGPPKRGGGIPLTVDGPSFTVSPDGRLLAVGSRDEPGVELWDVSDAARPVRRGAVDTQIGGGLFGAGDLWFAGPHSLVTVENGRNLRLWDVSDPDDPREGGTIEDAALGEGAGHVGASQLLITEKPGGVIQLWDLSRPADPREAGRIPAAPGSYFPTGKDELATALSDGTLDFWDVSDPDAPRRKAGGVRLDRAVASLELTPDGRYALTSPPHRLWNLGPGGRWTTPEYVTLEDATDVLVPPAGARWMAVVREDGELYGSLRDRTTFVLDFDTGRLYDRMCEAFPLSVPEDQWEALFPHLEHRRSCDS